MVHGFAWWWLLFGCPLHCGCDRFWQTCPERDGFLIHGGDGTTCAAGNPSDGCIVIEDENIRYKIKGGGTLFVTA